MPTLCQHQKVQQHQQVMILGHAECYRKSVTLRSVVTRTVTHEVTQAAQQFQIGYSGYFTGSHTCTPYVCPCLPVCACACAYACGPVDNSVGKPVDNLWITPGAAFSRGGGPVDARVILCSYYLSTPEGKFRKNRDYSCYLCPT